MKSSQRKDPLSQHSRYTAESRYKTSHYKTRFSKVRAANVLYAMLRKSHYKNTRYKTIFAIRPYFSVSLLSVLITGLACTHITRRLERRTRRSYPLGAVHYVEVHLHVLGDLQKIHQFRLVRHILENHIVQNLQCMKNGKATWDGKKKAYLM